MGGIIIAFGGLSVAEMKEKFHVAAFVPPFALESHQQLLSGMDSE